MRWRRAGNPPTGFAGTQASWRWRTVLVSWSWKHVLGSGLLVVLINLPAWGGEAEPSASFADHLYAKFQHARCLNCHHFNAADGMGSQPLPGEAPTSPRHQELKDGDCHACHTHAVTGVPPAFQQWRAPSIDMDWTGKSAEEACQLIKQAKQGEFADPTRMAEHLRRDRLIVWALTRGRVPPAGSPQVRDRVPGDRQEWITQVDAWINGGMRCN
jgi:hypothetical protein